MTNRNTHQDDVDAAFKEAKRLLHVQQIAELARRGRISPESLAPHEIGRICDYVLTLCDPEPDDKA